MKGSGREFAVGWYFLSAHKCTRENSTRNTWITYSHPLWCLSSSNFKFSDLHKRFFRISITGKTIFCGRRKTCWYDSCTIPSLKQILFSQTPFWKSIPCAILGFCPDWWKLPVARTALKLTSRYIQYSWDYPAVPFHLTWFLLAAED